MPLSIEKIMVPSEEWPSSSGCVCNNLSTFIDEEAHTVTERTQKQNLQRSCDLGFQSYTSAVKEEKEKTGGGGVLTGKGEGGHYRRKKRGNK